MGFYASNDPTNSVKALKEDRVLKITVGFNPTKSTTSCYNDTTHKQYDKKNTKKHKREHKWI